LTHNVEKIQQNWETFDKLCRRLSDHNLNNLLDSLGERIVMCPASTRLSMGSCYPGGLVQNALGVTATMRKLNDSLDLGVDVSSILKVGLLHQIGKLGDLNGEYYLEQESDWHRERLGEMYKYNEDIQKMSISHRTLFLLQHFGVSLSQEEWIAIQVASGSHFEENRFYVNSEPSLAMLLQMSKKAVDHHN